MYIYLCEEEAITHEWIQGRIYSEKRLEPEELLKLMTKAVKILGYNHTDIDEVCEKVNEILGTEPSRNGTLIDVTYWFANSHNIFPEYGWLEEIVEPQYMTKSFYTWYIPNDTWHSTLYKAKQDVRKYTKGKIGINIYE